MTRRTNLRRGRARRDGRVVRSWAIVVSLAVVVVSLGACSDGQRTAEPSASPSVAGPSGPTAGPSQPVGPTAVPSTGAELGFETLTEDTDAYEYAVEYPVVAGLPGGAAARINEDLRAHVEAIRDDFLASLAEAPPPDEDVQGELAVTVEVGINGPHLLSVAFLTDTYTGGANANASVTTRTYLPATGGRVELDDLLRGDFLPTLSELAIDRVTEQLEEQDAADPAWIARGAGPDVASLGRFVVTPDALELWFDEYQVAPGALGRVSILLDHETLTDAGIADPDGPLAPLLTTPTP